MDRTAPRNGQVGELLDLRLQNDQLRAECKRLRERLHWQVERVRAIQSMGSVLGSSLDLDEVLKVIVEAVTRLLEADRSTLFLVDDRREFLVARVIQGEEGRDLRLRIGDGIAGWVAHTGRPVNLKDAYKDQRFNSAFDQATGYRTRSVLCMPVRDPRRRGTVGVIQVLNKHKGYFSVADEELLRSLTSQAAITIENSKLFLSLMGKNMELLEARDQLRDKMRELDRLYELSQALQRAPSEEELIEAVLRRTNELIPCEATALLVADEEGGSLHYATHQADMPERRRGSLRVELYEGLMGQSVRDGVILRSDWPSEDPEHRYRLTEEMGLDIRSVLVAPLNVEDRTLGALQVMNRRGGSRRFGAEDQTLLSLIADQTAKVLDLRRQISGRAEADRLATIGQLLSGVLHDLKGPISIISGYVQLMSRKDSVEERQRYADIIHRQFEQLSAMTQEVLAFARGEVNLLVRKCYLHHFMAELEELFRKQVEGRGIKLILRDEHGDVAYFDQVKLTRALSNLVRNSIEAMKRGGTLTLLASKEGDDLIFTVIDTGAGIPEEIRGRLFETFVSGGKEDGSGLGLAIVRKMVEEHAGTISYESTPGLGTRFEIRIPQRREEDGKDEEWEADG